MIVTAVFEAMLSVVHFVVGLMPSSSSLGLPDLSGYVAAATDSRVWQYVAWANWYMPVDLALTLFGVRMAVWAALYGFEFLQWVLTKAHVLGGGA